MTLFRFDGLLAAAERSETALGLSAFFASFGQEFLGCGRRPHWGESVIRGLGRRGGAGREYWVEKSAGRGWEGGFQGWLEAMS